MAEIYTGGMRRGGQQDVSIRKLLGLIEGEKKKEGKFQTLAAPFSAVLDVIGAGAKHAIGIPVVGDIISALFTGTAKEKAEKYARSRGHGGDPEKIVGDFYTRGAAKTYRDALTEVQEEGAQPNMLSSILQNIIGSFSPSDQDIKFGEEGVDWFGPGSLGTYFSGQFQDYEQGGRVPTISEYYGIQGKTLGGNDMKSIAQKLGRRQYG